MDREKMIARHYLETGILGAYETTEVVWDEVVDGKCAPCFEDALVVFGTEQTHVDRMMDIDGRSFRIRSVFPAIGHTPTDKLLTLIDTELKKDTRTA
ncbi:MAG TPA: hypothetical protein PLN48_13705 [Lachnospiraceae bacterium]|jgi:hypothetical protein|nr:hypothetical protein [Lachnospiraceae bacterium]